MNIELRCKCGKMMRWNDGCVMGAYGPDTENCRDPFYYCECGNEVEVSERPPNSEDVVAQNSTSDNTSMPKLPEDFESLWREYMDTSVYYPGERSKLVAAAFYSFIAGKIGS